MLMPERERERERKQQTRKSKTSCGRRSIFPRLSQSQFFSKPSPDHGHATLMGRLGAGGPDTRDKIRLTRGISNRLSVKYRSSKLTCSGWLRVCINELSSVPLPTACRIWRLGTLRSPRTAVRNRVCKEIRTQTRHPHKSHSQVLN